ncbi:hypothetical protein DJ480_07775 [Pseudomonas sp. Leaf98]|nr:hypothetical protein DJ480_07775 [Pseudomonas sp. Leaf98]
MAFFFMPIVPTPRAPIVPTLCVGMPLLTLCVTLWDAERPGLHSHAERGNDQTWPAAASTIRLRPVCLASYNA